MENEVNTPPFCAVHDYSASFCLFCLHLSDPAVLFFFLFFFFYYFTLYFFFLSCFRSFHQSQSLDQVTLTNATILDGGGGGPNGSLAGSVGSVAVCLPSEPSLTDSLHTSAVSLPRKRWEHTRGARGSSLKQTTKRDAGFRQTAAQGC